MLIRHKPRFFSVRGEAFAGFHESHKGEINIMKLSQTEKRDIFRLFASGKTPQQIAEFFGDSAERNGAPQTSLQRKVDKLFEDYLSFPIAEKLHLTLMAECVSNRLHRLIDDIFDLKRVDARLDAADEKGLISLLDIKRKIKERMAKEHAADAGSRMKPEDEELVDEIHMACKRVFGSSSP